MTEQEENELICEKLLGWTRLDENWGEPVSGINGGYYRRRTPTFTDWGSAGMILDALTRLKCKTAVGDKSISGGWWCSIDHVCQLRDTGPLAIRAAALEYIRGLP